jgi:hypothetical protein
MVQARLNGFLPDGYAGEQAPPIIVGEPPAFEYQQPYPPVEIEDARLLQSGALSEAAFFAKHGFVLLKHSTAVRDWDQEVGPIYLGEIETIIGERLYPRRHIEIQQAPRLLRRGRGTSTPFYAEGVHSDGPLTADAYAMNVGAFAFEQAEQWWRARYSRDDVVGFVSIDFWRPTNMQSPLRHMPLALCAPATLDRADIFPSTMVGVAPEGRTSHHLALRFNHGQKWFYYPEMTTDELLAFKLCEFSKDDPQAAPQNVFHSAFRDSTAPVDAEERQSCEHRVGVLLMRD